MKLSKTAAETHKMLHKVYRDECLARSTIYEWFKRFKEGWEDLNDECLGRPRSALNEENVKIVRKFIKKEAKSSLRESAKQPMLYFILVL